MSATRDQDQLEARYRLLLRAYPASYRAAREDEIVGVLMDGAAPGQRRPSVAAAADLVRAGLAHRIVGTVGSAGAVGGSTWSDALAVVAVLFVMLRAFGALAVPISLMYFPPTSLAPEHAWLAANLPSAIGWSVVGLLVLRGRSAAVGVYAVGATVAGMAYHWFVVYAASGDFFHALRDQTGYLSYTLLAVAVSVVLCRRGSPQRGVELLGRTNVVLGAAAYGGVVVAVHAATHEGIWTSRLAPELMGLCAQALVVIPVLLLAARRVTLHPVGALIAAVVSIDAVSELAFLSASRYGTRPWVFVAEMLALVIVPVLVVRAVMARGGKQSPVVPAS
jgi:hypothetical protein